MEFLVAVEKAVQQIQRSPEMAPHLETLPEEPSVRRVVVKRFPFSVIYEHTNDETRILAIAHTRRKPNYWKKRCSPDDSAN